MGAMDLLESLNIPVLVAPMAGGPSTPALVNAAAAAGTIGFLAGGTQTLEQFKQDLSQVTAPFGVNLFQPQLEEPDPADLARLSQILAPEFEKFDLVQPSVSPDLTNGWAEKFEAALAAQPAVMSATFGCFSAAEFQQLHERNIAAWVTVTNPEDALIAQDAGADALVVQGPKAGGHRSTWSITEEPDSRSLAELLQAVRNAGVKIPLIAAGGIMNAADVRGALQAGAVAVSCGSAFLLCDEAGTSTFNRWLLAQATVLDLESVSSRAFSGRFARGVATQFARDNEGLPPLYPYLNKMITPLREAAAGVGNWEYAYCLVGSGVQGIGSGSAKRILMSLAPSALR